VSVSRGLAQAWLAAALRPNAVAALAVPGGPEPSPADVDQGSRSRADNALAAAAQAGLIREGADPIVIEIVAKDGSVLANGLSAERLAELSAALLPDPVSRNRSIERVPAIPGAR
jgi:anti-sigma factor RsiW